MQYANNLFIFNGKKNSPKMEKHSLPPMEK